MAILAGEPRIFPDNLFEQKKDNDVTNRAWWVFHTKPRQEKSLARQLMASSIPFYLPLVSKRFRVRRRTVTSHLPLFASYLFLHGEQDERVAALATNRVVRNIPVADQEKLWRDLAQVHRLIDLGVPITPEDCLAPGSVVEIKSGPLTGLRGKILKHASQKRFVVEIDFIHRGASIVLDDLSLAPVIE
jgi:transcription antitermination factor NusG